MLNVFFLYIAASLQLYHHASFSEAFSTALPKSLSPLSSDSSMSALSVRSEDPFPEDDNIFDIEAARRQFESLLSNGGGVTEQTEEHNDAAEKISGPVLLSIASASSSPLPEAPPLDVKIPRRPPLTSIERERRTAEIQLLGHLTDGDEEVVSEIYNLWFSERGAGAAAVLKKADELMEQGPERQREAELLLRSLIAEHGVYFTEPVNRLGTLYYVQGRLEEALTLNKTVLSIKPWHIGALSHIVMVYAAIGDPFSARQWAALRLPSFASSGSNRKRSRWVERAVVDATILLHQGEKNNALSFGIPDCEWIEKQNINENPNDAWQ